MKNGCSFLYLVEYLNEAFQILWIQNSISGLLQTGHKLEKSMTSQFANMASMLIFIFDIVFFVKFTHLCLVTGPSSMTKNLLARLDRQERNKMNVKEYAVMKSLQKLT